MTVQEQEAMFAALKQAHPAWSARFTSGYVEGVLRASESDKLGQFSDDTYGRGLLLAFAIHKGPDFQMERFLDRLAS